MPEDGKRKQFAGLIAKGVSVAEATQQVGVNDKTGRRWLKGRVVRLPDGRERHYAPVVVKRAPRTSERFLSEEERIVIGDMRRHGATVRAIGERLGRSPSTISRELARNSVPGRGYRPFDAHRRATARRGRPGRGKLLHDPVLAEFVQDRLDKRWSPAQIAVALRKRFVGEPDRYLAAETIYQAIYRTGSCFRRPHQRTMLRSGRRYRRRRLPGAHRPRRIVGMVLIDERPDISDRVVPGHWEGDLIVGIGNRSGIATMVERTTRYTILAHLGGQKTAAAVRDAVIAAFAHVPAELRRSLTWDQGNEMAHHADISAELGMPIYFCHPRSPWQRPTNEHTNGLLRQYFPKRTDLNINTPDDLHAAALELNTRPRQILGWDTPANQFATLIDTTVLRR